MSKKSRDLTADERKLWRRVAATAKPRRPLPPETEPPPTETVQAPPPRVSKRASPQPVKPSAAAKPLATLADRGGEKRVRRGKIEIDAVLDLHGYTQDAAFAAVATFLAQQRRRGARTVLVITGSGRGGEGVLKRRLPEWLGGRELKASLAGYAQAHRQHGGSGAFYVFLKRSEPPR